jgi:hypothetical protein
MPEEISEKEMESLISKMGKECVSCGCHISPLMGLETIKTQKCQNCLVLKEMQDSGALARQGLCMLDFM